MGYILWEQQNKSLVLHHYSSCRRCEFIFEREVGERGGGGKREKGNNNRQDSIPLPGIVDHRHISLTIK